MAESYILIVDDEPINAMVIDDLLSDLYKTSIVCAGEDALLICEASLPDLIILDVVMTGISGLETCR